MSKDGWTIAPCKGCGVEIEDEGPVTDDGWWCSQCWPNEDRKRLRAKVAELESKISGTDIHTRDVQQLTDQTVALSRELSAEKARADAAERERDTWIDKHAAVCDELHQLQADNERFIGLRNHQMQSAYKREEEQRQRADAAEKEAQEHFDNYQEMGEEVVKRDRRLADAAELADEVYQLTPSATTLAVKAKALRDALRSAASPATATKEPCLWCKNNPQFARCTIPPSDVSLDTHNGDKK